MDSAQFLGKLNFRVLLRVTSHCVSFYAYSPCNTSPHSRIYLLYKTTSPPHLDILPSITLYRSQLYEHLSASSFVLFVAWQTFLAC